MSFAVQSGSGLRIALAGASGIVGTELVSVLQERRFPVAELYPFASENSTGRDVEFGDEVLAVESSAPPLAGYDLMFVCTPRGAALDLVRDALRSEVICIDCSGALVRSGDVPLGLADRSPAAELVAAPVIAAPTGPGIAWGRVLAALDDEAGVRSVTGTVLQTASAAGSGGIEALSEETIALLSSQEGPPPGVFPTEVAFDCIPQHIPGAIDEDRGARIEGDLRAVVSRLIGREVPLSASTVQVPGFAGEASSIAIDLDREISPDDALSVLDKTLGIARHSGGGGTLPGPSTRDAAGSEDVLVGSVRPNPSSEHGLVLWVAADPVRAAAMNAVKLAEARTHLH
ncbi:MAG: Asd/ArgC dimerization domain-containing protein [Myxococcota bacterium]|nr:Asd/ArgC dimerization domain-containing protein [Myxococcota bacterium]